MRHVILFEIHNFESIKEVGLVSIYFPLAIAIDLQCSLALVHVGECTFQRIPMCSK